MNNSLPNSGQRNNCCWTVRKVTVKFKRKEIRSYFNIKCPKTDVYTKCDGNYQLCSGSNNTCMLKSLEFSINNSRRNDYSCASVSVTPNVQKPCTSSIKAPVVTTYTSLESSETGLTRLTSSETGSTRLSSSETGLTRLTSSETSTTSSIILTNSEIIETSTDVLSDKASNVWMNFQTSVMFVKESMTSLTGIESTETSITVLISTPVTFISPSMNLVTSSIIPTSSGRTSLTDNQSMTSPTSMALMTTMINTPVVFSMNALTSIAPTKTGITDLTSIESITSLTNTVIPSPKTTRLSINVPNNVTPTTSQLSTDVSYSKRNSPSMTSLFGVTPPESSTTSLTTTNAIFAATPRPSNCPADNIWPETLSGHNVTGFYCYKGTVNGKY